MEGDPCLSGRRGKDEEELVRIYLRDGSQGLLFSRGQVPGLPSCAHPRLWSKDSSRTHSYDGQSISPAQVLRGRTVTEFGAPSGHRGSLQLRSPGSL